MTFVPKPITIEYTNPEYPYHREIHCLSCGLPFLETNNLILRILDNTAPDEVMADGLIVVRCKRCKQPYHLILGGQI